MHRMLSILIAVLVLGCGTARPKVVDGTNLAIGAYIPYDGGLYGLNVVEYTSGCVIKGLPTNGEWQVSREYTATNTWIFGLATTIEHTKLDVKAE